MKHVHIPKSSAGSAGVDDPADLRPIAICSVWYRLLMRSVVQEPAVKKWLQHTAAPDCFRVVARRRISDAVAGFLERLDAGTLRCRLTALSQVF